VLKQIQNRVMAVCDLLQCSDHQVTGCKIHLLFSSATSFTETEIFSFSTESIWHQLNDILIKGEKKNTKVDRPLALVLVF